MRTIFSSNNQANLKEDDLQPGYIRFWDNYQAPLKEGTYTVEIAAELPNIPDAKADLHVEPLIFRVEGPRFSLPSEDIYSTHPADKSRGLFDKELPHIVLSKRTLPWERGLSNQQNEVPWFALVLLDPAKELAYGDDGTSTLITGTVQQLLDTSNPAIAKPQIKSTDLTDADKLLSCQSIRINKDVFKTTLPSLEELQYLCHCRQISLREHAFTNLLDPGWFSVVLSNRFPRAPDPSQQEKECTYQVHLISLEGLEDYLQGKGLDNNTIQSVQVISLANWAFTCLPEPKENFDKLLKTIAETPSDRLLLQVPPPPADSSNPMAILTNQQLSKGYVPMLYRTLSGEDTLAWYRGPLTPQSVEFSTLPKHAQTGKSYMLYDDEHGIFNSTYAVAWQLGRTLALADATYTDALMQFRWAQHQQANLRLRQHQLNLQHNHYTLFRKSENTPTPMLQNSKKNLVYTFVDALVGTDDSSGLVNQIHAMTRGQISPPTITSSSQLEQLATTPSERAKRRHELRLMLNDIALTSDDIPPALMQWFQNRCLLKSIPFYYLVPNPAALPIEGLRFFHVDNNWLFALLDGALSLGLHSLHDDELTQKIMEVLKSTLVPQLPKAGFLLRSELVAGWPNLAVHFGGNDSDTKIVRMERLASNVLLCLFYFDKSIPQKVIIGKPEEQMHFGVISKTDDDGDTLELRSLEPTTLGQPLPDKNLTVGGKNNLFFRSPADKRVLNIGVGDGSLIKGLESTLQVKEISSASLALELVQAPEVVEFNLTM